MAANVEQTSIDGFIRRTQPLLQEMHKLSREAPALAFPFSISDECASQVIRECFYASMTSDEGKWPKVTLEAWADVEPTDYVATFDPPLPVDAVTISKLAHSVSDWCSLGFSEVNDKPMLVGILPSTSLLLGTFVTQKTTSLSTLKVAIRCPGNIDVICEKGILSYKAGAVSKYQSILSSKALERLAPIIECRINSLLEYDGEANALDRDTRRLDGTPATNIVDSNVQLVISELVWRISEIGLGGTLIISDHPSSAHLSYKYRTNAGSLQNAVIRYWQAAHTHGRDSTCVASSRTPSDTLIHEGVMLRECVAATAQLAGTDGAIVVGTDFGLHGFGALIGTGAIDESTVDFVDGHGEPVEYATIVGNRGSRHQSALLLAISQEGVVVFVVSQDGHVTVLENHGGSVRVETGLRADGV